MPDRAEPNIGAACRGLCAHAYRLRPAGARQLAAQLAAAAPSKQRGNVDMVFPAAPLLGGPEEARAPCPLTGGRDLGDVGLLCQDRGLEPLRKFTAACPA